MKKKFPKNAGKNPTFVKLYRTIPAASPEAIKNRFLDTPATNQYIYRALIQPNPWGDMMRRSRLADIMEKHHCSEAKAKKIYKAEHKAWEKEYNSPLKVAERKIAKLENELARIREFIADPDKYDDTHSEP